MKSEKIPPEMPVRIQFVTWSSIKGPLYTWSNRGDSEQIIARKLDRVLVSDSWLATFPNSEADFTGPGLSDHTRGIVTIRQKWVTDREGAFKILSFLWTSHGEFAPLVEQVLSTPVEGTPMFRLCTKLKGIKPELKIFNSKHYAMVASTLRLPKLERTLLDCSYSTCRILPTLT